MRGTDDQTAFAVPRVALGTTAEVALPQPLAPSEAARIRHIFALQARGDLTGAIHETDRLDDHLLLGAILADRYLGGWMHPTAAALTDWLARYGDQPEAADIRALRERIAPDIVALVPTGRPLPRARRSPVLAATSAITLFRLNRDAEAVAAAAPLLSRPASQPGSGDALFAGGLAAWRLDDMPSALSFFDAAWRAAPTMPSRAADAFWAARAAQRQADRATSIVWLRRAAAEHDSFYGRIAARALRPASVCTGFATLGPADIDALVAIPAGRRAFALLQVGEKRRAEAEFRTLWADSGGNAALGQTLLAVARAVGLTELGAELQGAAYAASRGPAPPDLHPIGGFVIDPALVYALVHHESDFHPGAVSRDGAVGLMQIKPASAWTVNGARALAGMRTARLHDPAVNVAIGQRYLLLLADDGAIEGNLIRLLAAYKQGPFELRRWADHVNAAGDPLLFLEAMPNPATRGFVEDVLAWSWRYAAALHLPAASLDALAADRFPRLMRSDGATSDAGCPAIAATR
ncbi:MAG TPA: transglycosylase SLT domain-containing protein [Acetobacteraceae bacterium]|nr:transglycosylase SLT domain-containing protein [Acetobacteraceae bacterium]